MSAGEREGVVKFHFEIAPPAAPPSRAAAAGLAELGAWRAILRRLGVLGRDPARYGGYGFGNVSCRLSAGTPGFFVSASQTGHLENLGAADWVEVLECDPERNFLRARGLASPSAESMTHAAVYAQDPRIRCVLHGHSPEIFAAAGRLGLPATGAGVPYGTPAMAREVARLFRQESAFAAGRGCFVMADHEDGVIAFGRSATEAGRALVETLARALR